MLNLQCCGLSNVKWQKYAHWSKVGCDRNENEGKWGMMYCKGEGVEVVHLGRNLLLELLQVLLDLAWVL
jgi:hypothetical protein